MEEQLFLFDATKKKDKKNEVLSCSDSDKVIKKSIEYWQIFVDGAARGNPGPAGAGAHIFNLNQDMKGAFFLGDKTNNQAEYLALILALCLLMSKIDKNDLKNSLLTIHSDSELLIKQLCGFYKIKNPILVKLNNLVVRLLKDIPHKFVHVLRDKNKVADKLANEGIDKKKKIPTNFLNFLADFNEIGVIIELLKI